MMVIGPPSSLLRLAPDLHIYGSYPPQILGSISWNAPRSPGISWPAAVRWHLASLALAPWHQGWSPVLSNVARKHRLMILVPLWSSEQQREDGSPLMVSGVHRGILQSSGCHLGQEDPRQLYQGPGTRLS